MYGCIQVCAVIFCILTKHIHLYLVLATFPDFGTQLSFHHIHLYFFFFFFFVFFSFHINHFVDDLDKIYFFNECA